MKRMMQVEKKLLSTLKAEHANLQKQIFSLQEQMREKSKDLMKAAFASFFEKYSDAVENIFWNQYTPYFNDGESCEFSVYDVFITLKSDAEDEDFDDDGGGSLIYDNYDLERLKKKIAEIEAWKKDPRGEAIKYREDYIKNTIEILLMTTIIGIKLKSKELQNGSHFMVVKKITLKSLKMLFTLLKHTQILNQTLKTSKI